MSMVIFEEQGKVFATIYIPAGLAFWLGNGKTDEEKTPNDLENLGIELANFLRTKNDYKIEELAVLYLAYLQTVERKCFLIPEDVVWASDEKSYNWYYMYSVGHDKDNRLVITVETCEQTVLCVADTPKDFINKFYPKEKIELT